MLGIALLMLSIVVYSIGIAVVQCKRIKLLMISIVCNARTLLMLSIIVQCIGIKLLSISIVVQCKDIAYAKHNCAMHWN